MMHNTISEVTFEYLSLFGLKDDKRSFGARLVRSGFQVFCNEIQFTFKIKPKPQDGTAAPMSLGCFFVRIMEVRKIINHSV